MARIGNDIAKSLVLALPKPARYRYNYVNNKSKSYTSGRRLLPFDLLFMHDLLSAIKLWPYFLFAHPVGQ
jgi:hypothetical protein